MKPRIIIDSSADLPPELLSRCTVIPLTVRFGDTEYIDGVTIDHNNAESKVMPNNSIIPYFQA